MPQTQNAGPAPEKNFTCLFVGCRPKSLLVDKDTVMHYLKRALHLADIDTYGGIAYKFPTGGGGITAVEIVGASCADIHTWPEYGGGTAVVRCFACGDKEAQVRNFIAHLRDMFNPRQAYELPEQEIFVQLPSKIPNDWVALEASSAAA